jgi:hypothetical protein
MIFSFRLHLPLIPYNFFIGMDLKRARKGLACRARHSGKLARLALLGQARHGDLAGVPWAQQRQFYSRVRTLA